jgi:hypothetical protein
VRCRSVGLQGRHLAVEERRDGLAHQLARHGARVPGCAPPLSHPGPLPSRRRPCPAASCR